MKHFLFLLFLLPAYGLAQEQQVLHLPATSDKPALELP